MKVFLLSVSLLGTIYSGFSQIDKDSLKLKNLSKFELAFQGAGYSYEYGVSKNFAIDFAGGFGWGHAVNSNELVYSLNLFNPSIYLSANPKLFYNRKRRQEKGKTVRYNSGNYFGLLVKMTTPKIFSPVPDFLTNPEESRYSGFVNFHWGMQRPLGSKWIFNAHAGLGVARDLKNGFRTPYPALNFKFSYLFNRNRLK